ncbi:hypothetical protein WBG78_02355 [Chryseolinea sp. T2]|uniref:hypothetical protein n=1 Tax=Chryseolinea sp. T2 TaxID=3129255 RepID=UPI00307851FA
MEPNRIEVKTTLTEEANSQYFIGRVRQGSWIVYFILAAIQTIFFPEVTNLAIVVFIGLGWLLYSTAFMRPNLMRTYLFSSFIIFGYASTSFLFPLLFTTLEGKPVVFNLEYPEHVFLHALAGMAVLLVAHAIYRFLMRSTSDRSVSVMKVLGFYTPPTDMQLWIMGFVGLVSMYYVYFMNPDLGRDPTGQPLDKLVQSLSTFTYAPYVIICGALYGRKSKTIGSNLIPLGVFTLVLFALAIGRNSTGAFMFGFTTIAFAYLVACFIGVFKPKFFTLRNVIIGALGLWLLVGPLADLRTAMVIVRGERTEISAETLLLRTLEAYDDKEAIRERRINDLGAELIDPDWDELYVDNVFANRFSNVKFADLSLERADMLGEYDPDMLDFAYAYLIGSVPDPVIKFFGFDIDKELAYSNSHGDMIYLASGGQGTGGGFRVGHFAGLGMATFGWWYLGLLGAGMIIVFYLVDKFQEQKKTLTNDESASEHHSTRFSFCGLLALTTFFQFLQLESVTQIGSFLIRGWLQMALLYVVIFHLSRVVSGVPFKRLKWSSAPN